MSTYLSSSSRVFKRRCNVVWVNRRYVCQRPTRCIAEPLGCAQNLTKPTLAEGGVPSSKTSTSQKLFVGNLMLLPNSKNMTEALLVEAVNFLLPHS